MRVILTKYKEEVTTVRRSVSQVKVEAGGKDSEGTDSRVIELKPETPAGDKTAPIISSRRFPSQQRDTTLSLRARVDEISDLVDLHTPSNEGKLTQATYSMTGVLRRNPFQESNGSQNALKSEDGSIHHQRRTPHEHMGYEQRLINEERSIPHDLRVRKFVATQEMTEFQNHIKKKLSIEIKV